MPTLTFYHFNILKLIVFEDGTDTPYKINRTANVEDGADTPYKINRTANVESSVIFFIVYYNNIKTNVYFKMKLSLEQFLVI